MKKLITFFLSFAPAIAFAQFGVNFHQSNLPFIGINYEFADRVRPEFRISTDHYLEDFAPEVVITGDILDKESYEFYAGLGFRAVEFEGIVIPVGFNFYPLTNKNFGLHIELAPIIVMDNDDDTLLRGSWGIRYRFRKSE